MASTAVAKTSGGGGLARIQGGNFPALTDPEVFAEIRDSLIDLGGGIGRKDLKIIPFPSGGSTVWEIPDDFGGDPDTAREIVMVPVSYRQIRLLFPPRKQGQAKLGEYPLCSSPDAERPVVDGLFGDQGERAGSNPLVLLDDGVSKARTCAGCPMSKFGSAAGYHGQEGSRGQACQHRMMLFGLRPGDDAEFEGDLLPIMFSCPPTSVDAFREAIMGCLRRHPGIHFSSYLLGLTLKKIDGDNPYAVLKVTPKGLLAGARSKRKGGPEEGSPAAAALAYSEEFTKLLTDDAVLSQAASAGTGESEVPTFFGGGDFEEGEFASHDAPES